SRESRIEQGSAINTHEATARLQEVGREGRTRPARESHVGFYLVGEGRRFLEREIGYRLSWVERLQRLVLDHPRAWYFGSLATVTSVILGGLILYVGSALGGGIADILVCFLVALVGALPASELAVGFVHYLITLIIEPRVLPKL